MDYEIRDAFPLSKFGNPSDNIEVEGSSDLIGTFNLIDNEKMDLTEKLEDIEFLGFQKENGEINLRFKNSDDLDSEGVYEFTGDFLNSLFNIKSFYEFAFNQEDIGTVNILSQTISELFREFPEKKRQYRFLKYEDRWVLRGITSASMYKNYDNHLVLYLSLLAIHNYNKKAKSKFFVSGGNISDSDILISFEDKIPVHIEGLGDVYFRIFVSNGEIRQHRFSFEVAYRIDNGEYSFIGMPDPQLQEPLINITHSAKVESAKEKIDSIFELETHRGQILSYIKDLKNIKELSPDAIHFLFDKVIRSKQKFSQSTKNKIKELKEDNTLVNNTLTLIEQLSRINELTTDINEQIHLQRIYDDVIRSVTNKR
ncbi:hypothetical protein KXS12_26155 [Priestia filamentosa]|uniref:hypothetical protein n=1 Tax=Priestia filamentosa TaxID=1402861 RepID=UPI003F18DD8B